MCISRKKILVHYDYDARIAKKYTRQLPCLDTCGGSVTAFFVWSAAAKKRREILAWCNHDFIKQTEKREHFVYDLFSLSYAF